MKKTMKKIFSFVIALALVLGSFAFNGTNVSAADEYDIFVAFGGDAAASGDWGYGYAGGEVSGAITATNGKISEGETVRIGLEFAEPVIYTWYTAPTIVAPGIKTAYFTVKTFIDGEEIATDMTAGDNWWYEGTGDYDGETSIRTAGGYNEWGTKYIAEAPTGFTKLEYEVTAHVLSKEEGAYAFVAFGGDVESGDWGYGYAGDAVTGDIKFTDGIVAPGKTTTIGLEFGTPVAYTWYTAPTILAEGIKDASFDVKVLIDGVEVASDLTAGDNWWYENTGNFTIDQTIRVAGGYNEWGTKYIEDSPAGFTKLEYVVTCNSLSDKEAAAPIEYVVPTAEMGETTAQLCFADNAWAVQYWGGDAENGLVANNATIPEFGFGQYTVSLDFSGVEGGVAPDCAFLDLQIVNGQLLYAKPVVQIDEVKINGETITLDGEPYTSSDDGIETRVNLYNAWVSEPPADARTASGSLDTATPCAVPIDKLANISNIEVTFTLIPETQAYIAWVNSDWSVANWSAAGDADTIHVEPAVIYAPGEYSTKISFDAPIDGIAFAALMLDRGESMLPYIVMDVNKILVNDEEIDFTKGYTTYDNDGSLQTRVNLFNSWVSELPDDVRTADGSTDVSAQMISDALTGVSSVEVFFTVSQGEIPAPVEEVEKEPVVYSGEYHAYLQVQTNTELWIFRNNFDDATYGLGTPEFDGGLYSTTSLVHYPGTFNDIVIDGDGTYTVSLTGADFQNENHFSIIGVSTDIPAGGEAKYSNVTVKVNGKELYVFEEGLLNGENKTYDSLLIQSDWNNSVKDLVDPVFPVDSIEITFTVSGLGYTGTGSAAADTTAPEVTEAPATTEAPAATEAPVATEAPAVSDSSTSTEPAESSSNVGLIIGIVAAVVVIAVAVVLIVLKKKKK